MKSKWWISIGCFFVGLGLGIGITELRRVVPMPTPTPVMGTSASKANVQPALTSPVLLSAPVVAASAPAYRDRLHAIADLNSLLQAKIAVPLLNGTEVSPDFIKVYGLTTAEVAQLNESLTVAKKTLAGLQAQHASIKPTDSNGYSISIAPFPQEGGAVYDRLLQSIGAVLGDERFKAYRAMTPDDVDSFQFEKFGLSETTIDIRPAAAGTKPTASSTSTVNVDGQMKLQVSTNPDLFRQQYPEIYQKMVAAGLWKETTRN